MGMESDNVLLTTAQSPVAEQILSRPRLQPYLDTADGDMQRAVELYRWNQRLTGVVLKHSCDVEIAVRNALDTQLVTLCQNKFGTKDWIGSEPDSTPEVIYGLLRKGIQEARAHALTESRHRPKDHPRYRCAPNRDDVLAQLTFGTWDLLLGADLDSNMQDAVQQRLWSQGLCQAFPHGRQDDEGRRRIAFRLKRIRKLRNRAAHAENLLRVEPEKRLTDMLSVLSAINSQFPAWSMQTSPYRAIVKERP